MENGRVIWDDRRIIYARWLMLSWRSYIHGDGHNSRKYLYAGDVADALDVIFHRGEVGETYNIGSKFEISNLEFAQRLIKIFGYNQEDHIEFVQDRAFNDKRYGVDFTKLEALGWKPKMGFEEGLRKTSKYHLHERIRQKRPTMIIIYSRVVPTSYS